MQAMKEESVRQIRQSQKHSNAPRTQKKEKRKIKQIKPENPRNTNMKECRYCGERHIWGVNNCPAYGKKSSACGKMNHSKKVCQSRNERRVHSVEDDEEVEYQEETESESEEETLLCVVSRPENKRIMTDLDINGKTMKFQIDSRASINVIPIKIHSA